MTPNTVLGLALLLVVNGLAAAELPKAPVPKSPYLPVVYRYADTMLKNGRDQFGPEKTGLFLSALDRATLAPLTNLPAAPRGLLPAERVGQPDGPLAGANLQHDENLLRLCYSLSELSAKPIYREGADAQLKWMESQHGTQPLPWGSSWDVISDRPAPKDGAGSAMRRFFRPWLLWERCFAVAPQASTALTLELSKRRAGDAVDSARDMGFLIRTWAVAFTQTKDDQFRRAIEFHLTRLEFRCHPVTGWLPTGKSNIHSDLTALLSLAIDCDGAAHHIPPPLAGRLRAFATRLDGLIGDSLQDVKGQRGFNTCFLLAKDQPSGPPSSLWRTDDPTNVITAKIGMMCVSRYDNTGRPAYRGLVLAAADAYQETLPANDDDVWPGTFGQAISLQLAAWRHSADAKYMERARALADVAVAQFWGTNALPRASLKSEHYESATGADTLALALLELHLHILHITAVRCPPNTIDR